MCNIKNRAWFYFSHITPQVFSEVVLSQWHQQTFTCRLTLPNAMDEVIETSITLDVTGEPLAKDYAPRTDNCLFLTMFVRVFLQWNLRCYAVGRIDLWHIWFGPSGETALSDCLTRHKRSQRLQQQRRRRIGALWTAGNEAKRNIEVANRVFIRI